MKRTERQKQGTEAMKGTKGQIQDTEALRAEAEYTAWMVRDDGKAISCVQHLYGSDDIEETLYAAEWLYENTCRPKTKQLILDFLSLYAVSLYTDSSLEKILLADCKSKPYVTLTAGFVEKIGGKLFAVDGHLERLNRKVCAALNDEFMRARYGGKYNTKKGCKELYFRISSKRPVWSKVITAFLRDVPFPVETVTVVQDEESAGTGDYCKNDVGEELDRIPYAAGMEISIDFTK